MEDRTAFFLAFIAAFMLVFGIGMMAGSKFNDSYHYDKCLNEKQFEMHKDAVAYCKARIK